jgi:hypothetical protein
MPPAPHLPATDAADHAARIVALDAGDLAGAELTAAEALVASCGGCADLAHDLVAIRGAMTALPVPARRRDYRLTAEDAARLRPSGWRSFLAWLAAPGSTVRPLATGLATLGVVGLLLTSALPGLGGLAGGAAPILESVGAPAEDGAARASGSMELQGTAAPAGAPAPAPGATSAPAVDPGLAATAAPAPIPAGTPPADEAVVAGEAASADPMVDRTLSTGAAVGTENDPSSGGAGAEKAAGRDAATALPLPALASLALLVAGLALFAGRAVARRRAS